MPDANVPLTDMNQPSENRRNQRTRAMAQQKVDLLKDTHLVEHKSCLIIGEEMLGFALTSATVAPSFYISRDLGGSIFVVSLFVRLQVSHHSHPLGRRCPLTLKGPYLFYGISLKLRTVLKAKATLNAAFYPHSLLLDSYRILVLFSGSEANFGKLIHVSSFIGFFMKRENGISRLIYKYIYEEKKSSCTSWRTNPAQSLFERSKVRRFSRNY